MAEVIIEIVHGGGIRREFKRFNQEVIRLGRAFDNDVILSDPYVDAHHVEIYPDEEKGWSVKDCGSENGIFVKKLSKVATFIRLYSGDEFKIGKTRLRILSPEHKIPPTRPLAPKDAILKQLNRPWSVWEAAVAVCALYAFEGHLGSSENLSLLKLSSGAIVILIVIVIWAAVWAFVGRLIRHKANFPLQMTVTSIYFLLLVPVSNFATLAGYLASSYILNLIFSLILLGCLFSLLLFSHLTIATNLSQKSRTVSSSLITAIMLLVTLFLIITFKDEFKPDPKIHGTLKPPFVKIIASKSIDTFLTKADKIFEVEDD